MLNGSVAPLSFYVGARDFSVVEDVSEGIFALSVSMNGIMNVRASRSSRVPKMPDHVTPLDNLPNLQVRLPEHVTIYRLEPVTVVQLYIVADAPVALNFLDDTVGCCQNVRAAVTGDIEASVKLPLAGVGVRAVAVSV